MLESLGELHKWQCCMDKTSLLNFLSNFGHPLIPMQLFRRLAKHKMQVLNYGEREGQKGFSLLTSNMYLEVCFCSIQDCSVGA